MKSSPFITDSLLLRCRKEQANQLQRARQQFDPASLEDRKELSLLVEQAIREGENYTSIARGHAHLGLTERDLSELLGPEAAIRERIDRFQQI
ncbi:hypothetical protein [Salinicola rhizosphaerae]|uniref:Uncharacterized protein n=1 Tax=Salinicola rhizosphaerae TaxID=1443141 RepID=A0ABQ3E1A6_9GAMM|nr:hypothetical protein [Salinicola rhizosphaerae]GHB22408.1 hypothetical protein GCM10009038_21700 [Salinicola rhizosphaerae]